MGEPSSAESHSRLASAGLRRRGVSHWSGAVFLDLLRAQSPDAGPRAPQLTPPVGFAILRHSRQKRESVGRSGQPKSPANRLKEGEAKMSAKMEQLYNERLKRYTTAMRN